LKESSIYKLQIESSTLHLQISLGADCGVSGVTAKQWLSVLESSYVVMLLKPHHRNFGKRLVKSPKLYFLDAGLAAWLMGIRDAAGLESIELKSGSTFASYWLSGLSKWKQLSQEPQQASQLVYGGDESYERNGVEVWSWRECWKAGAEP